jgi:hypothetical protein
MTPFRDDLASTYEDSLKGRDNNKNDSQGKISDGGIRFSERFPVRGKSDISSEINGEHWGDAHQAMKHKIAARINREPKPPNT